MSKPRGGHRHRRPRSQALGVMRMEVEAIAKGGAGIARVSVDGRAQTVLVPRTAPGDVVDAEVRAEQGVLRGQVRAVVRASPDRVQPPCPWAERCGGCDLMHLTVEAQRAARVALVADALVRAGLQVPSIVRHDATQTTGYRTRVRLLAVAGPRGVAVGFRAPASHDLVEVDACLVLEPSLERARQELAQWLAGSRGRGDITIIPGAQQRPALRVDWQGELSSSVFSGAEANVTRGAWAGVQIHLQGARTPANIGDARGVVPGPDGLPLHLPPGGFSQAAVEMNAKLAARVVELASPEGKATLELFSGAGNLSVMLARHTEALETVEQDAAAVELARANLAARGLRAKLRDADANSFDIPSGTRIVIVDPPRTGAAGASERLARSRARRVVMVSCDAATLARDLGTLVKTGGFELVSVDVLEMFPHTSHVETVSLLRRE